MIEIVEGDGRDVPSIMPIMQDAFDPDYGEAWSAAQCLALLSFPDSRLLIAKRESTIAGFAITRWVLDEEELLMIGVGKSYQRQSIASALLDKVFKQAIKSKRKILFLEVREGNTAQVFYKKLGFEQVGVRKDYYKGQGEVIFNALTMKIAL